MLAAAVAAHLAAATSASAPTSARALQTARATTTSTPPSTATTNKPTASATATPAPSSGIPKSTVVIILAVGVPIMLALLGSIMIWGYMLGRRDEHDEAAQALRRQRGGAKRARRRNVWYVELAGDEVLEMATGANTAEMAEESRPPVELPALGAWLMMK